MIVTCPKCQLSYNDLNRWTICPHNSLNVASDAVLCERCDIYVGQTNIGTAAPDPDACITCGRTRAEILAKPR